MCMMDMDDQDDHSPKSRKSPNESQKTRTSQNSPEHVGDQQCRGRFPPEDRQCIVSQSICDQIFCLSSDNQLWMSGSHLIKNQESMHLFNIVCHRKRILRSVKQCVASNVLQVLQILTFRSPNMIPYQSQILQRAKICAKTLQHHAHDKAPGPRVLLFCCRHTSDSHKPHINFSNFSFHCH